jgi:hypothetical protein
MNSARFLVAVLIVAGATLAACSGNFGSGTTPPNGLLPSGNLSGISPTPTPTPKSASNIVTYGTLASFQQLPSAAGYGGAIAFPVPSPKPSGFSDIAIGATLSLLSPSDAPDLNLASSRGKKRAKRERPARALAYLTLIPTHDATLASMPRIAIDVPRDIVTIYRENEFGLALYNAGNKDKTYKLAAAELDTASTPPPTPSANPSAPPPPSAIPLSATPSPSPTASAVAAATGPSPLASGASLPPRAPGVVAPSVSPTLPPQRITFAGTRTPLKLVANRPIVFAIYAMPLPTPSPAPRKSGATAASAQPAVATSPAAGASASPALPAPASSSATAAASASATR